MYNYLELARLSIAANIINWCLGMVTLLIIVIIIRDLFKTRTSKKYRQYLTDMYVAGKIRKFAKTDDVSLEDESKNMLSWIKKGFVRDMPLDDVVEEELKERIREDTEKKLEKAVKEAKKEEKNGKKNGK